MSFSFRLLGSKFVLAAFLLSAVNVNAQKAKVYLGGGASWYTGDLQSGIPPTKEIHGSASLGFSYELGNRSRAKIEAMLGSVSGDDANYSKLKNRNLNFSTQITELSLQYQFDIIRPSKSAIVPYVFLGASIFGFNPVTRDSMNRVVYLHNVGTEGQFLNANVVGKGKSYNLTQMNLLGGVGVRAQISELFSIGIEYSVRQLFTDYLDDVSSNRFISRSVFEAPNSGYNDKIPIYDKQMNIVDYKSYAYIMAYRGDPNKFNVNVPRGNPNANDQYQTLQIKLCVGFPKEEGFFAERNVKVRKQLRCPL